MDFIIRYTRNGYLISWHEKRRVADIKLRQFDHYHFCIKWLLLYSTTGNWWLVGNRIHWISFWCFARFICISNVHYMSVYVLKYINENCMNIGYKIEHDIPGGMTHNDISASKHINKCFKIKIFHYFHYCWKWKVKFGEMKFPYCVHVSNFHFWYLFIYAKVQCRFKYIENRMWNALLLWTFQSHSFGYFFHIEYPYY